MDNCNHNDTEAITAAKCGNSFGYFIAKLCCDCLTLKAATPFSTIISCHESLSIATVHDTTPSEVHYFLAQPDSSLAVNVVFAGTSVLRHTFVMPYLSICARSPFQ